MDKDGGMILLIALLLVIYLVVGVLNGAYFARYLDTDDEVIIGAAVIAWPIFVIGPIGHIVLKIFRP